MVILVHRHGSFDEGGYFLKAIAEIWRESGWTITVCKGPGARVDADVTFLHVDLTVVPKDHLDFLQQYPIALNGKAVDISKRAYSRNLVGSGEGSGGSV